MQVGRGEAALASFQHAVQLQPDNPTAERAWADSLARSGRVADALPHYARAVELRPGDASGHAAFGFALVLSDREAAGVAQWEEALRLDPKFPGLAARLQKIRGRDAVPAFP